MPGRIPEAQWASSGTGSAGTLSMELFRLNTGIKIAHIPYKGAGPANVALLVTKPICCSRIPASSCLTSSRASTPTRGGECQAHLDPARGADVR